MESSFAENAVDYGLSLDMIEEEIEAGLPLHADRLAEAWQNEEYYQCRNAAFIPRREGEEWRDYIQRPKRTSKLTRKVVRELTKDLYNPGPTRKLESSPAADAWLQDVYRKNHLNALMQQADRKATLNGVSAVQAVATGREEKPIQLYLWGAHEFVVWTWPDDPTEAWACCTIQIERRMDKHILQQRLRFEAWTAMEHRVYRTRWSEVPPETSAGFASNYYRRLFGVQAVLVTELSGMPEATGINPYGVLPFAFVHNEPPVSDFSEGGIGTPLRDCNAEIDRELSDLAAHVKEFMDPDRFIRNVAPAFRREKVRGRWQPLPPAQGAKSGDNSLEPDAFLVQAELAVEQVWANALRYMNGTIEELDVPLVAVRDDASTDLSGVAIVGKQLPMLSRTRSRQLPFTATEEELASMVLAVGGNFYQEPRLTAAAKEPKLNCLWPEPKMPLPTPERDAEDQADLESGRKSLLRIVAERNGVTIEQAKEILDQVLDENQWYAELLKSKGLTEPAPGAGTDPAKAKTEPEPEPKPAAGSEPEAEDPPLTEDDDQP